jgi:DNA-binding NarL/FixJ family response regulator
MVPPPIRIVVADDHALFRDGLCRLLQAQPGFEIVGQTGKGSEVPALVMDLAPDLLLLDLAMPGMTGLEVLRALESSGSKVRAIVLTAQAASDQVLEALRLGARGLVLKEAATDVLLKCMRAVMSGEYWFSHQEFSNLVNALRQLSAPAPPAPAQTLTTRELTIIAAVVDGATNRDIARQLEFSEQTVKNCLSQIFDKLGVSNRLELALYAIDRKLLDRIRK